MDIQDIGAIGELISSIAVVITLIYLARQIHQNTLATQASNSEAFVERHFTLITPMATDKEFCERWLLAGSDFENLDEIEQQQFILYEWRAISSWNHFFHLREQNLVADSQWSELLWLFQNIGKRGSVVAAWKAYRGAYSAEFRNFMDSYLINESSSGT
jgi:hypothetical protein